MYKHDKSAVNNNLTNFLNPTNESRYQVDAEVHMRVNKGYRVKVSVTAIGLYINGMLVYPPNQERADWAIYPPALQNRNGQYTHTLEFDKNKPLWLEIFNASLKAVQNQLTEESRISSSLERHVDVVAKVDLDSPINLDDIPI